MKIFRTLLTELNTGLEYHNVLNRKLWTESDQLRPEVRSRLLQIADLWAEYLDIDKEHIHDVIVTGGNANYNYTDQSDIDVHLVIDEENVYGGNKELTLNYLFSKFSKWRDKHHITIYGYPIECGFQDINEVHDNQGTYSIVSDKWLIKPSITKVDLDDPNLKQKVLYYIHLINKLIREKASYDDVSSLVQELRNKRGAGIQSGGEFSIENLVYKALRNRGYLDKLSKYGETFDEVLDRNLSLE